MDEAIYAGQCFGDGVCFGLASGGGTARWSPDLRVGSWYEGIVGVGLMAVQTGRS